MELRVTVGGDPEGGWMVDVHDGDRNEIYRPDGSHKTPGEAALAALVEHCPDLNSAMHKHDEDIIAAARVEWESVAEEEQRVKREAQVKAQHDSQEALRKTMDENTQRVPPPSQQTAPPEQESTGQTDTSGIGAQQKEV